MKLITSTIISFLSIHKTLALDCQPGQFDSSNVCTDCSAGYYNNVTSSATTCTDECPTGSYSLSGASECTDCPIGTTQFDFSTQNTDSDSCTTGCEAGYGYSFANSACEICTAGSYSFNVTIAGSIENGCETCATGYTTDGVTVASSCFMCSEGYEGDGTATCSLCRTGTTSVSAVSEISVCDKCTSDDGCYNNGICTTSTGVCTCDRWHTGTFCDSFDSTSVSTDSTTVHFDVDTGITWDSDYADSSSTVYQTLQTKVEVAVAAVFSNSIGDGFLLTEDAVTFSDSSSSRRKRSIFGLKRNDEFRAKKFQANKLVFRIKRSTGTVIATPEIIMEHLKTATSAELVTYVSTAIQVDNNAIVTLGWTLPDPDTRITHSTSDSMLSGSTCRTGTQSTIPGADTCDLCNSHEGCFSHGSCVSGDCVCSSNYTGNFCGQFNQEIVEVLVTDVIVDVDTGFLWRDVYEDETSEEYIELKKEVTDVAVATFEKSVEEGYVLKSVSVKFFPGSPRTRSGSVSLAGLDVKSIGEKPEKRSSHQIVVSETTFEVEHEVATGKDDTKSYVWERLTYSGANNNNDNEFIDNGFIAYNPRFEISDSGLSAAAIAGIVLGCLLVLCILVILVFGRIKKKDASYTL